MLQINYIRENKEEVIQRLSVKNFDGKDIVERILKLYDERIEIDKKYQSVRTRQNQIADAVAKLHRENRRDEAFNLKIEGGNLKQDEMLSKRQLERKDKEIDEELVLLPNLPSTKVPKGKTSADNEIISEDGKIPDLGENAKPHWELASQYDIIDFELGSKITGSGFPVYKDKGAKIQRSLINFFLDKAVEAGYMEIQPPVLVNEASGYGTGQLPDKDDQMYHIPSDNLYLSPTAEVPLTNIYRDVILKQEDLPIKITACTPCFRREAGSYGKDVKGLNRVHQFDKVEIVQIQHPCKSYEALEEMCKYVAGLLKSLELPYRVAKLCGGDLGFTSALTYDMEVYSAAQQKWLEVSSISNFETFQANRLKLRFKGEGKTQLAHTLNGSALALPRILAALLENNQTPDGIKIPAALVPYTGFEIIN